MTEKDLPGLINFLLPLEPLCLSFTSRLISNGKTCLPPKREAIIFAAVKEEREGPHSILTGEQQGRVGNLPPISGDEIIAAVLMTSRGMILPVHKQDSPLPPESISEILNNYYHYSRKIYCILGISSTVQQYERALRERIDASIRYHLMFRSENLPLPRNIFTPNLKIQTLGPGELQMVYPLEVEYQYEEVLVHPERFSPAAHIVHFKRLIQSQYILFGSMNGFVVAKAGTNAIGFHNSQIGGVYTDKKFRGRGIARALMLRLLEEIYSKGHGAVLFVRRTNAPAVHLYKKLGFRIIDEFQIVYTQLD